MKGLFQFTEDEFLFGKEESNSKENDQKLKRFTESEEYTAMLQEMINNHIEAGNNLDKFITTNPKGRSHQTLDLTSTIIRKYKGILYPNSTLTNISSLEVTSNLFFIFNKKTWWHVEVMRN